MFESRIYHFVMLVMTPVLLCFFSFMHIYLYKYMFLIFIITLKRLLYICIVYLSYVVYTVLFYIYYSNIYHYIMWSLYIMQWIYIVDDSSFYIDLGHICKIFEDSSRNFQSFWEKIVLRSYMCHINLNELILR